MAENVLDANEVIPAIEEYLESFALNATTDSSVEEPLDSISSYAVAVSAERGPLSEEQITSLLRQKFDRRKRNTTKTFIQKYTSDIPAVVNQLTTLRLQIRQMRTSEDDFTGVVKNRIKKMIKDIKKKGRLPCLIPNGICFTTAVTTAIEVIGRENGPLTEEELKNCIRLGRNGLHGSQPDIIQLQNQLDVLIIKIDEIENINKLHSNFAIKQNDKMLDDITEELSQ